MKINLRLIIINNKLITIIIDKLFYCGFVGNKLLFSNKKIIKLNLI